MAWQTGKMARMVTRPRGLVNGHIRQFFCHDCDGSQQYKYNTESLPSGNTNLAEKTVKLIDIMVNSRRELHRHVKFCSWGGWMSDNTKEKKKQKKGKNEGGRKGGRKGEKEKKPGTSLPSFEVLSSIALQIMFKLLSLRYQAL